MLDNYLIIDYNRLKKGGGYMKGKIKFVLVLTIIVCVVLNIVLLRTPLIKGKYSSATHSMSFYENTYTTRYLETSSYGGRSEDYAIGFYIYREDYKKEDYIILMDYYYLNNAKSYA